MQPDDRHVTVDGVTLHYRAWGHDDALPMLILHGLTGHAWEFDPLASALADRFRVLVLNQRGHGASGWTKRYSPALMATDVAHVIAALGLEPVRLIGHSMGGDNGWWFAANHPNHVQRLAILDVDPGIITRDDVVELWADALTAYAEARYPTRDTAVASYLINHTGDRGGELRRFAINNLTQDEDGRWRWRFDAGRLLTWMEHAAADAEAHWSALRNVACPTLIVRGMASPFTTAALAERMVETVPQAQMVEIPGASHDIHIDQPAALLKVLGPFLEDGYGTGL